MEKKLIVYFIPNLFVTLYDQIDGSTLHAGEVPEGQNQREVGGEAREASPDPKQDAQRQQGLVPQAQRPRDQQEKSKNCKLGKKNSPDYELRKLIMIFNDFFYFAFL